MPGRQKPESGGHPLDRGRAYEPGELFNGKLSIHRVPPVGATSRARIIALLSYDRHPDQVFSADYIERLRQFPRDADREAR